MDKSGWWIRVCAKFEFVPGARIRRAIHYRLHLEASVVEMFAYYVASFSIRALMAASSFVRTHSTLSSLLRGVLDFKRVSFFSRRDNTALFKLESSSGYYTVCWILEIYGMLNSTASTARKDIVTLLIWYI